MEISDKTKKRLTTIKKIGVDVAGKVYQKGKTYMSDDVRRGRMGKIMEKEKKKGYSMSSLFEK